MSASNPKQFAKQICEYLKKLPDKYADDPQDVQDALGLSDADFKAGVDWCVAHKLITLDQPSAAAAAPAAPKPASASPFSVDEEDETVGDRKSVFGSAVAAKDDDDEEDETVGDRDGVFGAGEPAGVG